MMPPAPPCMLNVLTGARGMSQNSLKIPLSSVEQSSWGVQGHPLGALHARVQLGINAPSSTIHAKFEVVTICLKTALLGFCTGSRTVQSTLDGGDYCAILWCFNLCGDFAFSASQNCKFVLLVSQQSREISLPEGGLGLIHIGIRVVAGQTAGGSRVRMAGPARGWRPPKVICGHSGLPHDIKAYQQGSRNRDAYGEHEYRWETLTTLPC